MLTFIKTLKNPKQVFKNHYSLFSLAVILFWFKSYFAYQTEFKLGVEGWFQQFILLINPISSAILFFGLSFLFKGKGQSRMLIFINFALSFWLYANIVYYRFYNDFLTLPSLLSAQDNAGQLSGSVMALLKWYDITYFADFLILFYFVRKKKAPTIEKDNIVYLKRYLFTAICVFLINLGLAEMDRPQLLSRSFDRNYLVKYLGTYNFTIYDIIQNTKSMAQNALANSEDVVAVENYVKANYAEPDPNYFGKAKGRNLILISLESLQNFVIDYKVNDMEVSPFLNSLSKDSNTFYFDNFFHQTGQGKTSDAEFMNDTSLFPMSQGAVYVNKAQNVQQALPAILNQVGYNSNVFHGNYKTFWNRNEMYRSMGYNNFFDAEYYNMTEENTKNYGLKDVPFFDESVTIMKKLPQPFFAKMITLSNHFPFGMDEGDTDFPVPELTDDSVVNQYFQSVHYLDDALKQFFDNLKANGLYDNSIIVMYGDHYGISSNHDEAMAKVIGKEEGEEMTPFDEIQLQRTVFMIHAPGIKAGVNHNYAGEVDIRPTILHLLGIDTKNYLEMGSDMLSPEHNQIVPFRNGDFVSPQYTFVGEKFYDNLTGEKLPENPEGGEVMIESVKERLNMSDEIIEKNLLRFYTPAGFLPVDRQKYNYLKPTEEKLKFYKTK
ncbi:MAG: polyglycerolphosphate lipoteichoic acid synthase LtaS [Bacillales bacterium]|jgi:lipoteichoic acid synthase|nr:polyglycerolphosphate lipoteichoic acid synthase LtaS [Bacillales bacterium]